MSVVESRPGVLITCDIPTREFILHLNETHNFLLEQLDETHLLIDSSFSQMVQDQLARSLERHVYSTAKAADA